VHTTSTDAIKPASIKEDNERPSSPDSQTVSGDTSSDVTLVGDTILTPDSETDDAQKETAVMSDDAINDTTAESDDQAGNRQRADSMEVQIDDANPDPPSRDPPPVPPRPAQDSWKSEAEKAANQHDVHEVVGNVLDKTLCAIKPDSIDADGNRSDKIKE
jgi:ubiquitin carboxyl-terminal hydrolase 25/28